MELNNLHTFARDPALRPIQSEISESMAQQLITMTPWKELGYQASTLQSYFLCKQEGFTCLYLSFQNQPAGIVTIRSPWLRGTLLELLAILPDFQQQGLGSFVMNYLHDCAIQKKQKNLWTLVSNFNEPAMRFYQYHGFTKIGQIDNFIAPNYHELLLRKTLSVNNTQ